MIRRRIDNDQKLAFIAQARQWIANGDSIRSISWDIGIHMSATTATKWLKRDNLI